MQEQHNRSDLKKWFILGLALSWTTVIPVAVGLFGTPHSRNAITGVRDLAGSVIISFTVFGLAITALSQAAAIVLLLRIFPFGYRVFSALSICWSGLVLVLPGVCMWMLLAEVVMH